MPQRSPRVRAALCMAYFYLTMTCYYILKPVRESFFLGELGYTKLPYAHLAVMAVAFVAVQAYIGLVRTVSRRRLVLATNLVFIAFILGFWLVLGPGAAGPETRRGLAMAYYCWVACFSVFAVTLFWSFTHSIFTADEGPIYYGTIGAGGTLGAFSGGAITKALAERLGTIDLMLVSGVLLAPCIAIGYLLAPESAEPAAGAKKGRGGAWPLFRESPYLRGVALMILLAVFAAGFDDYRIKGVMQGAFPSRDARTAFLGEFFAYTNVLGLFIGLVLTAPLQTRWGPLPGLLAYPLSIIIGGVALSVSPTLPVVFWVSVVQHAIAYTIFQTSRELLFLPTTKEEKFIAKGFITTFVFRFGTGLAAIVLLKVFAETPGWKISYYTVPTGLAMLGLAGWLSRRYDALVGGTAGGGSKSG